VSLTADLERILFSEVLRRLSTIRYIDIDVSKDFNALVFTIK
jgi:hypothetical protein